MIFCATFSSVFKWTPLKWIKRARRPIGTIKTILCYEDNVIVSKLKQFRINWRMLCNYSVNLALQVYGLNFHLIWASWEMLEVIYFHGASLYHVKKAKRSPPCNTSLLYWDIQRHWEKGSHVTLQSGNVRKNPIVKLSVCIYVWLHTNTHIFPDKYCLWQT